MAMRMFCPEAAMSAAFESIKGGILVLSHHHNDGTYCRLGLFLNACCCRACSRHSAIFSQSLLPVKGAKGPAPPLILFTSSHDKTVRCFDLSKGRQTKAHSNGGVVVGASCRGPGPGTWACGCADGSVKVFKVT